MSNQADIVQICSVCGVTIKNKKDVVFSTPSSKPQSPAQKIKTLSARVCQYAPTEKKNQCLLRIIQLETTSTSDLPTWEREYEYNNMGITSQKYEKIATEILAEYQGKDSISGD
jgi:hypothetical protein